MNFTKDSVFNKKFETESELIDAKKYFKEYHDAVPSFEPCPNCFNIDSNFCKNDDCKNDEIYRSCLGISQDELDELKERTSIDHLQCEFEMKFFTDNNPENLLKDISQERTEEPNTSLISVQKKSDMIQVSKSCFTRLYYKYSNHEWSAPPDRGPSKWEFDKLHSSEFVVSAKIYYPFISIGAKTFKIKLLQEIHILGSQTLSQLKDKIPCAFDYIGGKDMSNEWFLKDVGYNITAKDEYPSSFIFIENTFYNDTRTENHKDLSKELRKWAAEKNIANFQTGKMETTKMSDLNFSLGKPYMYQHQGNCEHIIMFSDVRLLDPSVDPPRYSSFPRVHCTGRTYGKRCMMCSQIYAKWLVIKNERLTHEQAYLCNKCFVSYNYVDGQKLGDFLAFNYVDPIAIL